MQELAVLARNVCLFSLSSYSPRLLGHVVLTGSIASADRRPVDPPPVVELRIFEGQTWQEAESKDVTFHYNANFMLYVTLEHARVMAHGRVQTPAANNQPPVLTGMPVSGMAYLDRPQEAGYFLFPDLSVRHEGRYRLHFHLFEETKVEEDKDPETADDNMITPPFSNSFDFRMELKSRDFNVFSAKKFPGLKESTQLSRVVAEQGCRVRIRRDIRMRRRDVKPGADFEEHAKDEYSRHRRTETPEIKQQQHFRPRSMSGSADRASFSGDSQRRSSGADYPPPPFGAHQAQSASGHLQFLANAPHGQYPQPAHSSSRTPSVPPSPSAYQTTHASQYSPHAVGYQQQQQQQHAHPSQQAHQMPQQQGHRASFGAMPLQHQQYHQQQERSMSQSHFYPPSQPAPQRDSGARDFREPAAPSQYRSPAHVPIARAPSKEYTVLPPYSIAGGKSVPSAGPLTLPPINTLAGGLAARALPPLGSPVDQDMPPLQAMPATGFLPPPPPVAAGMKRTRDDAPRYEADMRRYQNGARDDGRLLDEDGEPALSYNRADGAVETFPPGSSI